MKGLVRFCAVPRLILHSRSPSRYIEFQTWILSRARGGERGWGGGLTPSPVNPATKVESRKLGWLAGKSASFYLAREIPFVRRPFCISRVCILPPPPWREENRRKDTPSLRHDDAPSSRRIETFEFQVPPDGNPDGKNRGRKNETRVEINGFSRLSRWGESNLRTPLSSGGPSTKKRIPRRPIDLLAGNVSIESGDIFVNRAHLALSDLIPRVELRSSVTLPFEAIEPWCHAESSSICQPVQDISLRRYRWREAERSGWKNFHFNPIPSNR